MLNLFRKTTAADVIRWVEAEIPATVLDKISAVILYGPHAVANERRSTKELGPIHLLIVLAEFDQPSLVKLATAIRASRLKQAIVPMVVSREELVASTDVFPVTFMEMQRRYQVLKGEDVLADLEIRHDHLRLRCEQELRNLTIRMQSTLLLEHQRPAALVTALRRAHSSFLRVLPAALTLAGQPAPKEDTEIAATATRVFDFKEGLLDRTEEVCQSTVGDDVIRSVYLEYGAQVRRLTRFIDQLPHEVTVLEVLEEG